MIRINLLPFRAARKVENVKRQVMIFFMMIVLTLGGLIYYHINLTGQVAALEGQVEDTSRDLKNLQKKLKEIASIDKLLATVKKKTKVIENLELTREASVRMVDAMTQLVIEGQMHLTLFDVKGNAVSLQGVAADNQTIADFMMRLEKSGMFNKVVLDNAAHTDRKEGPSLKRFVITCSQVPLKRKDDKKGGKKA